MDLNFFQWFRSAIRQTVLLGVSDAMKSLGTPETTGDAEEVHPQLAMLMNAGNTDEEASPAVESKPKRNTGGGRKRLGKSLKELDMEAAPAKRSRRKAA